MRRKVFSEATPFLSTRNLWNHAFLRTSPLGDVFDGIAVGEGGGNGNHENL
jgi:hypothetical protein